MRRFATLALFLSITALAPELRALGGGHAPPPLPPPPPPGPPPSLPPSRPTSPHGGGGGAGPGAESGGKAGAPATGGAGASSAGAQPSGPSTATSAPPKGAAGGVPTAPPATGIDVGTWEYWWLYNRDAYLELKQHIAASTVRSGSLAEAAAIDEREWERAAERVQRELLAALASSNDPGTTRSALIALARSCDGPLRAGAGDLAKVCVRRLGDADRAIAESAILALGVLGHEASLVDLAALACDAPGARKLFGGRAIDARARAFATYALGLVGARTASPDARRYARSYLRRTLAADAQSQWDTPAATSIALGLVPLAGSISADGDGDARTQITRFAAGALPDELAALVSRLHDTRGSRIGRAHLPRALARLAATSDARDPVARALLTRLDDRGESSEVVQGCVLALGELADATDAPLSAAVRRSLVARLDDGNQEARNFAAIALARNAARGEGRAVDATRALLAKRLADGSARERTWAALALGVLEQARLEVTPAASANALATALRRARSPEEVGAVAIGCGLARVASATEPLLEHLQRMKEQRAQGHVALALGLLGTREALEPLRTLLADSKRCSEKLPQTATALALLEDSTLVPSLLALLGASASQSTFAAASQALGAVGDRRAVDPLLAVVRDGARDEFTRAAAIGALGRLCDRDRLPWQAEVSRGLNYLAMTVTLSDEHHGGLLDQH